MMLDEVIQQFAPGDTFALDTVTVLGPYPTPEFFEELRTHEPGNVVLYADDGIAQSVLEDIKKVFPKKRYRFECFRVAPESGGGLVHAKVYLFEWKNDADNQKQQTKRCLLVGSANASIQGFSSHAETFLCTRVAARADISGVVKYFERLREHGSAAAIDFDLDEFSKLWLPAIRVVTTVAGESFDAWLRRGMLCHKYEPNQNFGKLTINLKKPLPVGEEAKAFIDTGFSQESGSTRLVRPYVELPAAESEGKAPHWRAQNFTETHFGFWSSEACYKALDGAGVLTSKAHDIRERTLNRIGSPSDSDHQTWAGQLLERVQQAADQLGDSAQEFLHMKGTEVDWKRYREVADKKLKDDLRLARDPLFSRRYISGYDFQQVPPLGEHFEGFAISFVTSLLNSMHKGKTLNRLGQCMKALAEDDPGWLEFDDPTSFIGHLRKEWPAVRDYLTSYYQD